MHYGGTNLICHTYCRNCSSIGLLKNRMLDYSYCALTQNFM